MCPLSGTEEANAAHQSAVCNAGSREDDLFARGQIVRVINLVGIGDAHRFQAIQHFVLGRYLVSIDPQPFRIVDQTRLDLAVQTFDGSGGEHTFGSAADSHQRMNVGTGYGRRDSGGKIAVRNQTNARAGRAHVIDDLFVALAIQNNHRQVFDVPAQAPRDVAQVILHRRIDVDYSARRRPDDDLVHVDV